MASPFPGMDPYLEGYMWPDVHQALAYQFRRQLVPLVAPGYAVRLAVATFYDEVPPQELGVIYPNTEIVRVPEPVGMGRGQAGAGAAVVAAPLTIPMPVALQVRLVTVEVRDVAANLLVTSIEILSPTNKREPGISAYRKKRSTLLASDVHLLEIDLLRRGRRLWPAEHLPASPYLAVLVRARHIRAEVWPIGLRERLPVLPVPLRAPDADVPLDLQAALDTIYAEARYELTLNYNEPPPEPPLSEEDAVWVAQVVAGRREH